MGGLENKGVAPYLLETLNHLAPPATQRQVQPNLAANRSAEASTSHEQSTETVEAGLSRLSLAWHEYM